LIFVNYFNGAIQVVKFFSSGLISNGQFRAADFTITMQRKVLFNRLLLGQKFFGEKDTTQFLKLTIDHALSIW
jgi:hypothetical protein